MWDSILQELSQYSIYQWLILLFGVAYAILSMLNKPICWFFGIVSCSLLAFKDFTQYDLYFDGVLQVIYVLMGILGIINWMKSTSNENGTPNVISLPIISHINAIILGVLTSLVLVVFMQMFLNPAFATLDSLTTVFSIWATWLLVNRIYETWIYFIIINSLYIYIYQVQAEPLIAVLSCVYLLTSIGGLLTWKRTFSKSAPIISN